jgi:hypothetical protein
MLKKLLKKLMSNFRFGNAEEWLNAWKSWHIITILANPIAWGLSFIIISQVMNTPFEKLPRETKLVCYYLGINFLIFIYLKLLILYKKIKKYAES